MSTTQDADDDLASGWDLPDEKSAADASPPGSGAAAAWDAAADEIDAGWDIEPSEPRNVSVAARPEQREAERAMSPSPAPPRAPVVKHSPARQISTKKFERTMSRKNREREAQAKAKREAERKAQRKAEQAKHAERLETLRIAERKREQRPRVSQRKPENPKPKTDSGSKTEARKPRDVEPEERSIPSSARSPRRSPGKAKAKAKANAKTRARAKQRRALGAVLTLVALGLVLFLAWKLAH